MPFPSPRDLQPLGSLPPPAGSHGKHGKHAVGHGQGLGSLQGLSMTAAPSGKEGGVLRGSFLNSEDSQ